MTGKEQGRQGPSDRTEIRIRFSRAKILRLQALSKHFDTTVQQITRDQLNKYLDEHAHIVLTVGVALALTPLI